MVVIVMLKVRISIGDKWTSKCGGVTTGRWDNPTIIIIIVTLLITQGLLPLSFVLQEYLFMSQRAALAPSDNSVMDLILNLYENKSCQNNNNRADS